MAATNLSSVTPLTVDSAADLLRIRWAQDRPYTGASDESRVVVAVNPLKEISGLRGRARWSCYDDAVAYEGEQDNNADKMHRIDQDAHVYAVSSGAMRRMSQGRSHQAVIVSGESGAGKTETSKILLEHFAKRNKHSNASCVNRILAANPVLEAFGNASTASNENSSRFGKLLSLGFDAHGRLANAECRTFLFERSRVANRLPTERNFHVFYQLLAGLSRESPRMKLSLGLYDCDEPDDFAILRTESAASQDKGRDFSEACRTLRALSCLAMSSPERSALFKTLCAVLHLGNVDFCLSPSGNGTAEIDPDTRIHAGHASRLMGMGDSSYLESALCERAVNVRGESIVMRNTIPQAVQARDALCSELYFRAFQWIVEFVNAQSNKREIARDQVVSKVALLDVMGFEVQQSNSLEQLLINYANERLQFLFSKQMVLGVQDEYHSEGLLDLTQAALVRQDDETLLAFENPSKGLLALLEQECFVPGGSDGGFVRKLSGVGSKHLSSGRLLSQTSFAVKHFAGLVEYSAERFLEKNLSALPRPVVAFLDRSPLVATYFSPSSRCSNETSSSPMKGASKSILGDKTNLTSSTTPRKMNVHNNNNAASSPNLLGKAAQNAHKHSTVGMRFKGELDALLKVIESSDDVAWIRCIRPNAQKDPSLFDAALVKRQLQASGVVAAVALARQTLPVSMRLEAFESRFGRFLEELDSSKGRDQIRFGRTKVYMPEDVFDSFVQIEQGEKATLILQSTFRMNRVRSVYLRRLEALRRVRTLVKAKQEQKRSRVIAKLQTAVRERLHESRRMRDLPQATTAKTHQQDDAGGVLGLEALDGTAGTREVSYLMQPNDLSSVSSSTATLESEEGNESHVMLIALLPPQQQESLEGIEDEPSRLSTSYSSSSSSNQELLEKKERELEEARRVIKDQERVTEDLRRELERLRVNAAPPPVYLDAEFKAHKFSWRPALVPWALVEIKASLMLDLLRKYKGEAFVVRRPRRFKIGLAPSLSLLESDVLLGMKMDFATRSGRFEIAHDWALDQLAL